jgi:hypothetical protein
MISPKSLASIVQEVAGESFQGTPSESPEALPGGASMKTNQTKQTNRTKQTKRTKTTQLTRLSQHFVDGVFATLRGASVEDLSLVFPAVRDLVRAHEELNALGFQAPARAPSRRSRRPVLRPARTTEEVVEATLGLLASHPDGLRSEEIAQALEVHPARLRLALVELVQHHPVERLGRARGVRYALREEQSEGDSVPPPSGERLIFAPDSLIATVRERLRRSAVPLTAGGLAPLLDQPKEVVRAALDELVDRGEVLRQGAGRYRLAAPTVIDTSPPSGEISALETQREANGDEASAAPSAPGLVTGAA